VATVTVQDGYVDVQLRLAEEILALHGSLHIPLYLPWGCSRAAPAAGGMSPPAGRPATAPGTRRYRLTPSLCPRSRCRRFPVLRRWPLPGPTPPAAHPSGTSSRTVGGTCTSGAASRAHQGPPGMAGIRLRKLGSPRALPLFPAVPRTKDGPFALRALCCRPGQYYYGPSRTADGPAASVRLLGSAAGTRSHGKPPALSSCGPIPVNRSMPSTPEVGGGSSGRPSPPPAAFARRLGARLPRFVSRRGRFHLRYGPVACPGVLVALGVGPSLGFPPAPRRPPPRSLAAFGRGRLRLGGRHVFLGQLASLLAECDYGPLPPAPTGTSPSYAGGATWRLRLCRRRALTGRIGSPSLDAQPTNNRAERAVRRGVLWRKCSLLQPVTVVHQPMRDRPRGLPVRARSQSDVGLG